MLFLTHLNLRSEGIVGTKIEEKQSPNGSAQLPGHALREGHVLSRATVYQYLSCKLPPNSSHLNLTVTVKGKF